MRDCADVRQIIQPPAHLNEPVSAMGIDHALAKPAKFVFEIAIGHRPHGTAEAVVDIRMQLQGLLGEAIKLEISLDASLWPVSGDAARLEDVLIYLVANARDAMPDGGIVRINARNITKGRCEGSVRSADGVADYVVIKVADQGVGISDHIRDRIFEPFASTNERGCGFGLAKVRRIVTGLSGRVTF
jgi:two-component system cell cycle sensor histidine kinase/response regulator CckA